VVGGGWAAMSGGGWVVGGDERRESAELVVVVRAESGGGGGMSMAARFIEGMMVMMGRVTLCPAAAIVAEVVARVRFAMTR
jgi:hypothetical protein